MYYVRDLKGINTRAFIAFINNLNSAVSENFIAKHVTHLT
jgi:hypothetical protein